MSSVKKACEIALKKCLCLKSSEKLLIVYDSKKNKIANSFLSVGKRITEKVTLLKIKEPKINGEEPSKDIADKMLKYDVILLITSKSLSHTDARRKACENGARLASMPNINEDIIKRSVVVDYKKMSRRAMKIQNILKKSKHVKIINNLGTDISMNIQGREINGANEGIMSKKGDWGNLPAGEVYLSPLEGSSNGILVVDKSFAGIGKLKKPIKIIVKDGFAVKILGSEGDKLDKILKSINDKDAYNIAELGIGTNDRAKINGCVLEDEKVFGTAHIALGNNRGFGGKINVPVHLDGIFSKPTIFVDNKKIMENGKLLI